MQKHAEVVDRFRINKNHVKMIFVDETLIQIDGKDYWLWIAYEPNVDLCLMVHISRERTIFVCYQFFKELRKRFGRKLIFTDGARWYNDACKWLRLKHQVYGTELKNIMERFIQKIKDRTECFDDHFPCRSESCNRQHVTNWIKMFILYLHMKTDRIKLMEFLMRNSKLTEPLYLTIVILEGMAIYNTFNLSHVFSYHTSFEHLLTNQHQIVI